MINLWWEKEKKKEILDSEPEQLMAISYIIEVVEL